MPQLKSSYNNLIFGLVMGAGVHDGLDEAVVELVSLEKVTLICTYLGTAIIIVIMGIYGWV